MPFDKAKADRWSYWDRSILLRKSDVVIAGSGIVGLSAALSVKETHPNLDVLVLERGPIPHGASTRNAGFACIGSITELEEDLKTQTAQEVFRLVKMRKEGLDILVNRLGKDTIDYQQKGGFEIFTEKTSFEQASSRIKFFNNNLREITHLRETFTLCDINLNGKQGMALSMPMICNKFEAQLNTGKMMDALLSKCLKAGIRILNSTSIIAFTEKADGVEIMTDPFGSLPAARLLICTNGFASELIPDSGVKPARAQVLITAPVPDLCLSGTFHYDSGYVYFRDVEGRVLLGGARNLNFKEEETTDMQVSDLLQNRLEQILQEIILPGREYKIEQRWAGVMGLGDEKMPIIKMIGRRTACAVRMGGMGVALGSAAGAEGARLILNA
jgi:glycine/D-amino acid oxidase-like deaminating enzyme